MEILALILFYITLIGILACIGLIVFSFIKKDFKYRPKKLAIVLGVFIVAFMCSSIFYAAVQSPESKSRFEASQKTKAEEKAKNELAEAEKKAQEEKLKQEEEQAKEEAKAKEDVDKKEKEEVQTQSEQVEKVSTENIDPKAKEKEDAESKAKEQDLNNKLISVVQNIVKNKLKTPSTAEFPWSMEEYKFMKSNGVTEGFTRYTIKSYVDSQNSFGAEIRSNFTVILEIDEKQENYKTISCDIKAR